MAQWNGRSRDDAEAARIASGSRGVVRALVAFLKNLPPSNEVAEVLVLRCLAHLDARSAVIMMADPDGSLRCRGAFGSDPEFAQSKAPVSYWDPVPIAAALRSEQTILLPTAHSALEEFPSIEGLGWPVQPCVAFPLTSPTRCIGVVAVVFGSEVTGLARVDELVSDISALLSLYFHCIGDRLEPGLERSLGKAFDGSGTHARPELARKPGPYATEPQPAFSPRQKAILALMSEGMTNVQIAFRIGFSESTVRHETMAIFDHLGVAGRHEAVDIARRRGLLDPPDGPDPR